MLDESKNNKAFLIAELIKHKSLSAKLTAQPSFAELVDAGILKMDGEFLVLSFSESCCQLLATEFLQEPIASHQVKSLEDGLALIKRVTKKMVDAGVTSATSKFKKYLLKDIIIVSFKLDTAVSREILELQFEKYFHEVVDSIFLAIPELPVTAAQAYQVFRLCYHKNDGSHSAISKTIESFSFDHGHDLLQIAIADKDRPSGLMANILVGYYLKDDKEVWLQLNQLRADGHDREVVVAITHLPLKTTAELKTAIDFLENITHTQETRSQLVFAYTTLISSQAADEGTISLCLAKLYALAESADGNVGRNISFRLVDLPIPEKIKCDIILKFDYQREDIAPSVFHLLQSINPALWFPVLRQICLVRKMKFDPREIAHALKANYQKFPEVFSDQLAKMMTDNAGLVRYGACKILQEVNEDDQFVFRTDLLSINEQNQLIFVDTLLTDFLHPAKVIRFLLTFRNSSHRSVLQSMINNCALLIEDYMGEAIAAFRNNLDKNVETDAQVLKVVEKYYGDLSKIIDTKLGILELSPVHSQATMYNYFIKMAHDRMRVQLNIDRSSDKNSIFSMIGKVMIARGRYWKLEGKDKPTPLSTISKAITFPRTYFLNPDDYNWNIKVRILTNFNGGH